MRRRVVRPVLIIGLFALLTFFAASALGRLVSYYTGPLNPGDDASNYTYSNQYNNAIGTDVASPLGLYQVYGANGSVTRRRTAFVAYMEYSGSPIYTRAHCYNPSGPNGPQFIASCAYANTVP